MSQDPTKDNFDLQEANTRLRERIARMVQWTRLDLYKKSNTNTPCIIIIINTACALSFTQSRLNSSLPDTGASDALEEENRHLKTQLEEARRVASRLCHEKEELNRQLEEKEKERETLRHGKADLEEQKRLLDRALEKMNKDVSVCM